MENLSELKVRCPYCNSLSRFTGSDMNDVLELFAKIAKGQMVYGGGLYCSNCSKSSEWSECYNASIDLLKEQFK